ncbi:MAG: SulP family inorganic anion transporter [Myxococcota bacterium]
MTPLRSWVRAQPGMRMRADVLAGLTTGVMLIPQAMAYAMLAGLPPIVGLYASTLPLLVYAVFGTSRELAVGPVAMDSLLVASALAPIAAVGSDRYLELAVLLALMVGAVQLVLGLLRAGGLLDLLKRPVISGFTSAAAIIIGLSQLSNLLGVSLPREKQVHRLLLALGDVIGDVHLATVTLGVLGIVVLKVLAKFAPKVPRALVVVVLGSVAVSALGLDAAGVAIVGEVPSGLPALSVPSVALDDVQTLLPSALVLSLVAFMEAASVGKAVAAKREGSIDPSKELVGLGLANAASALVGGYVVTGGFSRTAVNAQAGARSRWSGVVTALLIITTLLFLTGWFQYLPNAMLAAIIMSAVFGLVDLREARRLWSSARPDFALWVITFSGTLFAGIEIGIGAGVLASLVLSTLRRLGCTPAATPPTP